MSIVNGLAVLFIAGILVLIVYVQAKRSQLPVTFKSFDEVSSVGSVADWAQTQIATGDPRRQAIFAVSPYLPVSRPTPAFFVRISADDLALLAPFIDQFIVGQGPPLNQPAEYEDWRPTVLRTFKERMQAEGLWPPASATTPPG
jgi:hypothetical protein